MGTPQRVMDAIWTLAEYLALEGYSEVLITPNGETHFHQGTPVLARLSAADQETDRLRTAIATALADPPAVRGVGDGAQFCADCGIPLGSAHSPHCRVGRLAAALAGD